MRRAARTHIVEANMRQYKSAVAFPNQQGQNPKHIYERTGCMYNDDHRTASGGDQHFASQSPGRLRLHPCHTRSLHPISWQPSRACMCRIRDPALLYPGCRRTCCALKVRAASVSKMRSARFLCQVSFTFTCRGRRRTPLHDALLDGSHLRANSPS